MNNSLINKFKKALETENIPVIEFMINENMIDRLDINNSKNENALHILCKNYNNLQNGGGTINNALKISSVDVINKQDINGNTPIINAVGSIKEDNDSTLCTMLEQYGADRKIRNNEGYRVKNIDTDTLDTDVENENIDIDNIMDGGGDTVDQYSFDSNNALSTIQEMFGGGNDLHRAFNIIQDNAVNNNFVNEIIKKREVDFINETDTQGTLNMFGGENQSDSSKFFDNMINMIKSNNDTLSELSIDTDAIVSKITNGFGLKQNTTNHTGGGDTEVYRGKRMLKLNERVDSISLSGGEITDSDDNGEYGKKTQSKFGHYARQLSRLLDNQKKEVFERVVNKVMELMKVDNETARMYKTTLIRMAKKKNADLVGLDLATEVEKLATTDVLKKIDIDKEKKAILRWREEYSKSSESNKKQVKSSKSNKKQVTTDTSDSEAVAKKKIKKVTTKSKKVKDEGQFSESPDIFGVSEISLNDFSISE